MRRANAISTKQFEILTILTNGNGFDAKGNLIPCDLDQLKSSLSYKPSKESLQFSVRALIKRDFVYKGAHINRRNRKRVLIVPTDLGRKMTTSKITSSVVEGDTIPGLEAVTPEQI